MITTDTWECIADIKRRTGIRAELINPIIKQQMAEKTCECRLDGDETLLIPYFRTRQPAS